MYYAFGSSYVDERSNNHPCSAAESLLSGHNWDGKKCLNRGDDDIICNVCTQSGSVYTNRVFGTATWVLFSCLGALISESPEKRIPLYKCKYICMYYNYTRVEPLSSSCRYKYRQYGRRLW